jgi:hypothetical protein
MGKCSNLTILQSQHNTFQKGKDDRYTDKLITVLHQPIENFIEDLPALFKDLFTQPYLVLLQYPALSSLANKSIQRKKATLLTDNTSSDIGVVDIDSLEGIGNTIEEQVDDIIDRFFPIEWKLARKIIKPSSSYYMKGQSKFHVFFHLDRPIKHGSWQQYVNDVFQHHDKTVLANSASLLYTAKPEGKLVNSEFKCIAMDGDKLSVNTDIYVPNPAITISNVKNISHDITLKGEQITKGILERKLGELNMGDDSYSKSFWMYQHMIAEGYDSKKLADPMIEQLNNRPNKKHYIQSQHQAAMGYTAQRCVDNFYSKPELIEEYIDIPELVENITTETEITINAIKGVTGVGKTQAMKKFSSGTFLCISPTKLLVGQNAKEFDAQAVHSDMEGLEQQIDFDRVSTTIQSLHRLLNRSPLGFDTLFIDEAAQSIFAALMQEKNKHDIFMALKALLFSCTYIVFADADLTVNTIQAFELALEVKIKIGKNIHVTKKDFFGRTANLYETRNELIEQLIESLKQGRRCLAISDRKSSVQIYESNLSQYCKKSFFFTADKDKEESLIKFRENPKEFIQEQKPQLLLCTPLLKSGVSFVEQFDDVFVMVDCDDFTARDIIQMLSRERKWSNAYIYTNRKMLEKPHVGNKDDNYLLALNLLEQDKREQLLVRPFATAYRLDSRGCLVNFVTSNSVNFERIEIDDPNYAEKGADGRSIFEDYVLSIICNGKKANVVRNIINNRRHLEDFAGATDAIKMLMKDNDYIAFYDFCRSHSPALITNKSFSRFAGCMKQWGLDDGGFFKALSDDGIRRSDLRKNKSLMKRVIDEAEKPNNNAYVNALENLKVLSGLMPIVDKFETNNREEIEMLLKTFYAR